jgi:hypothetical protein
MWTETNRSGVERGILGDHGDAAPVVLERNGPNVSTVDEDPT